MFRYLAVVWNAEDVAQCEGARRLADEVSRKIPEMIPMLKWDGIRVWAVAPPPVHYVYTLEDGSGVVLGTLFGSRSAIATPLPASAMAAIDCAALTSDYWGRYVAFLFDARSRTARVLRDPSAGLYCFRSVFAGCDVYFSNVNDYAALGAQFSVDWQYVAAYVAAWMLDGERTFIREVHEVQPGRCVAHRNGERTIETYWNPANIALGEAIEDREEARGTLRHAVTMTIQSWAALHRGIVVHASGGLDSSIIWTCLRRRTTGYGVHGLNYYAPGADSDERAYARRIAEWVGHPLIEWQRNSQVDLSQMLKCEKSLRLDLNPLRVETSRKEAELAKDLDATLVMCGGGGDQVFGSGYNHLAAADYARAHGLRAGLWTVALNAALLERRSIWSVLGCAVRHGILRQGWNPLSEDCSQKVLVSKHAATIAAATQASHHEWWQLADHLPAGKLAYLSRLWCRDVHDPMSQPHDPDLLQPLMSQPVLCAGLRIASFIMSCDGWDRGLARCAFEDDLPPEIARRRNKGGAHEHVLAMWEHNRAFARRMLSDGVLVQQGLLDAEALSRLLDDNAASGANVMEALHVLSAEARLRAWL